MPKVHNEPEWNQNNQHSAHSTQTHTHTHRSIISRDEKNMKRKKFISILNSHSGCIVHRFSCVARFFFLLFSFLPKRIYRKKFGWDFCIITCNITMRMMKLVLFEIVCRTGKNSELKLRRSKKCHNRMKTSFVFEHFLSLHIFQVFKK